MTLRCALNNEKRGVDRTASCQLVVTAERGRLTNPSTSWQFVGHFQEENKV